ncbi:MAG: nitrogen fixation negative regulator NifL [Methylobacter sp.]|uniref:nitrogen fixation negative regulator NifL n=1 Tax=Methylobacter sp. TaxID=2051955 RepID=UPI0027311078|nr:nitrogen fixation negative regulator NifL [Methylobacter sp.]MDP1666657.1 nitrogen fixation negative regulator NifL [Methylobacter sp.]MDP1969874.1 nitrogen fixation negative regulator NifL [Methylobacter sp.]
MKKTSLRFLQTHTNMANVIGELAPDLFGEGYGDKMLYSLFAETVEQVPIAISITDKKAKILYVNQEFCRVTGYRPEDILGENESLLSDKHTPKEVYHDLWRTISSKKIWRGTLCNRHKSGQRYLSDLTIAPMLNETGAITHYIGMHRDITQAYESEKKVINQKLLIESVINSSPIAMVVLDDQDRVILDNHNYKALVSDLDKGEPATYFLRLLREEMGDLWSQLQSREQGFNNREFKVESKGSQRTRWFSCAGNWFIENEVNADAFFENASKQYLILTLTDITRQRRQMEELHIQTLKTIMAEDERVRGIRETLLGAMHQIQMPMNQIRAAEQILKHKRDDQHAGLLQILQQIQQSGEEAVATMQKCIPEILQTAVIPVNINQILHEVLLLNNQRICSNDIEVHWQPLSKLPTMLGSENRLRILFKQLIDNAIEAICESNSAEQRLKITTDTDADLIYVSIEDSGAGIPVEKRAKVFEPFYTTRAMGGNQAGMGLVMAKEIVNQHQGFIEIDPDYDQGCRFKISFPLHRQVFKGVENG